MPDTETIFNAPVKWEQNLLTHSPGEVALSSDCLTYRPSNLSVLSDEFSINLSEIKSIRKRDNFLWRGAVKIDLATAFKNKTSLIFFLGGKYKEFMTIISSKVEQGSADNSEQLKQPAASDL